MPQPSPAVNTTSPQQKQKQRQQQQQQQQQQQPLRLPAITLTNPQNLDQPPSPALSPLTPITTTSSADKRAGIASVASITARWTSAPHKHPAPDVAPLARPTSAGSNGGENSTWKLANDGSSRTTPAAPAAMSAADTNGSPAEKQRKFRVSLNNVGALSQSISHSSASAVARDSSTDAARSDHLKHAIDPLSSHIIKRTSASPLTTQQQQQPRRSSQASDTSSMRPVDDLRRSTRSRSPSSRRQDGSNERARDDLKRGVKVVSFITRLVRNKPNKDSPETIADTASIMSEAQPEGNEAEVFSQTSDPNGYNLRSTRPPAYIKVRAKNKEKREFDRMFLAQELVCGKRRKLIRTDSNHLLRRKSSANADADTVWAMEFSRDGKHLAAGGADTVVRVWKVLASTEERRAHESQESDPTSGSLKHSGAPVLQSEAVREFVGHEAPILDLSWSKNGFLLSSSMDKTVRLWHMSRKECICTFKHNDFVPSIAFHPKDDRYFLTGSLDAKLRMWSIDSKSVICSVKAPDMITAVAFMPDGKYAIAGTLHGSCLSYETEGLKYKTQLQIRPDRGQGVQGPKITGISSAVGRGGEKLLITSNDSRTRLYNVRDKGCEVIFKGNVNDSSQIRAALSDDGRYVVCGSEDRRAYVWSVTPAENGKIDRRPVEYFDAHDSVTTVVRIAPARTRRLLDQSDDPVYDLCNTQSTGSPRMGRSESRTSSKPSFDPALTRVDSHEGSDGLDRAASMRSSHKHGNIIVTADYAGKIKVFRQDCAWNRRQQNDWERGSLFRRGDRNSMASSLQTKSSQRSLRDAKNSAMAQVASSDRIMNWRQDIAGSNSTVGHSPRIRPQSRPASPGNVDSRVSQAGSADTAISGSSPSTLPTSAGSVEQPTIEVQDTSQPSASARPAEEVKNDIFNQERRYAPGSTDPLYLDGPRSYLFWDKSQWLDTSERAKAAFTQHVHDAEAAARAAQHPDGLLHMPPLNHSVSYVSRLSDEGSGSAQELTDEEDETFDDAKEHQ